MNLEEAIYSRQSCRAYTKEDLSQEDREKVESFIQNDLHPLYPNIRVEFKLENRSAIKTVMPWMSNQVITIYSEVKNGYGLNVGFMGQHLELYLHTIGLSCCWVGLAKPVKKDHPLEYIICMAIGYARKKGIRDFTQFKRKDWSFFSDQVDKELECARLAPSSVNSQPWFFTHENDWIHMWYIPQKGPFHSLKLNPTLFNQIDLGIALAHICICHEGCTLSKNSNLHYQNYLYILSIKLSQNV